MSKEETARHPNPAPPEGRRHPWLRRLDELLEVPADVAPALRRDIVEGASPSLQYYILMTIAAMVAALGLVTNSTAVVIGAMLISPLMTPIFGVALGLASGDLRLARRALFTEFLGVGLAMLAGAAVGMLPLYFKVTPEILARTHPTLLDLGVAGLAGGAGCLAMLNPRLSPVLPGIAIATSLVPPLAASGLCLALGSPQGGLGAFLLFFANFLAILLVAGVLFVASGLVARSEAGSGRTLARRFLSAFLSLAVVCFFLGRTLFGTITEARTEDTARAVLKAEIASEHSAALNELTLRENGDALDILATLHSAEALSPGRVGAIQEALAKALGRPVRLVVRSAIVRDVSPPGARTAVADDRLDGEVITEALDSDARRAAVAEQTVREIIEAYPGINLRGVEQVAMDGVPTVLASIESSRGIPAWLVGKIEDEARARLKEPELVFVARHSTLTGITRKGRILYGDAHLADPGPAARETQRALEDAARDALGAMPGFFAVNVDAVSGGDGWRVRAEVVGPRMLEPADIARIEKTLAPTANGAAVSLQAWCRAELLVEAGGFAPKAEDGHAGKEDGGGGETE